MAKSGLKFGNKSGTGYTQSPFSLHKGTTAHTSALKQNDDDTDYMSTEDERQDLILKDLEVKRKQLEEKRKIASEAFLSETCFLNFFSFLRILAFLLKGHNSNGDCFNLNSGEFPDLIVKVDRFFASSAAAIPSGVYA